MQTIIQHLRLGPVIINSRCDSRAVKASWKRGCVVVTAPAGFDPRKLLRVIDEMVPELLKMKPSVASVFREGTSKYFDDWHVNFTLQNHFPDEILVSVKNNVGSIAFWVGLDEGQKERLGSKGMKHIAAKLAPKFLSPHFNECARKISKFPSSLAIVNTTRRLGSCNRLGQITLSSHLMFLPRELRELVFYHELAHLSYLNHSPQFHALLNEYVNGRERELNHKLKAFRWPLLR